jgi:hypothetical protein
MNSGYSMTVAISLISTPANLQFALWRTPLILTLSRAGSQQQIENQERDPDVYGCISDIEDEKVPSKGVQIKIIDDGAVRNPINCIAESAADNQSEADRGKRRSGSKQPRSE